MLESKTSSVAISSITVAPDRQRKEFKGIEELAKSIVQVGLIHPIIITPDGQLVAGERRLRAHQHAGLTHVLVRYTTDLPAEELERIELEENIKRSDLSWREENSAIARYHYMRQAESPDWTMADTAEALSVYPNYISSHLGVAEAIADGDELVIAADTFSVAKNIVARKQQRAKEEALSQTDQEIKNFFSSPAIPTEVAGADQPGIAVPSAVPSKGEALHLPPKAEHPFLLADFQEWASIPHTGAKFNFVHCDFPYGINFDKHNGGATGTFGGYEDSAEVYWSLIATLGRCMETHIAKSAHLMFWLSPKYLADTIEVLTAQGWKVNQVPLIWHRSDNSGILPDPKRGPRQVYEVCLMASRGDRYVVQAVSNLFACPKSKEIHASEKPREMLAHFFRMFVDESTVMLDPTMGSGNSVRVAEAMGAKFVLGLEMDEKFFANACAAYIAAKE